MDKTTLRIDSTRLLDDFTSLSRIGATPEGGVHRPALTEPHLAARAWLAERIRASGLEFSVDAAGNHSGRLPCGPHASAPTLLIGSHLDSVPQGGRFDGALGVLAGLEVLRTVQDAQLSLPYHLEVIDFTDEEGTLVGLLGSRALAGTLPSEDLIRPRGGLEALEAGFARAGITDPLAARRSPDSLAGYLELHIEQGDRLTMAPAEIGIVTALVGIGSFDIAFQGQADHAGTTPMDARRDAGLGAASLVVRAHELVRGRYPGAVVNFGAMRFSPGAFNIVPERAEAALEFRSAMQSELEALETDLLQAAWDIAGEQHLGLTYAKKGFVEPASAAPEVRAAFEKACRTLGLRSTNLVSGAGHDMQALAAVCPAGMIFIPSTGGSHNPAEFAAEADMVNGANVLLQAALSGISRS